MNKLVITRKTLQLLKVYILGQTAFKIFRILLRYYKAKFGFTLGNVDGKIEDLFMFKLMKNVHRFEDYEVKKTIKYPKSHFVKQNIGSQVELLPTHKKSLEFILRDEFRNFSRGQEEDESSHSLLGKMFGQDTITFIDHTKKENRKKWLHQRIMVESYLTSEKAIQRSFQIILKFTRKIVENLSIAEQNNKAIDMNKLGNKFVVDAFQKVFFNENTRLLDQDISKKTIFSSSIVNQVFFIVTKVLYPAEIVTQFFPFPLDKLALHSITAKSNLIKEV
eukprot:snap_masked-scaffold_91-processed-gene-0.37-mRNA-1 protein AED:1.00 eAED:1.00 QI:0/-1/0/0/-1/1/1/0/276